MQRAREKQQHPRVQGEEQVHADPGMEMEAGTCPRASVGSQDLDVSDAAT